MFLFVIAVILTLIALGAILLGVSGKHLGSVIGGIAGLVVAAVLIAFATVTVVPTKTVGIPVTFGVVGQPMPNGLNLKAPWTDVELMDMTVQSLDASEDNPTVAKDIDDMDVFVHNNVRWAPKQEATDDIFNDIKNVDGDNMKAMADKFIQPAHRAVVQDVMATYNPLDDEKPTNTEVSEAIKAGLIERIGDRFFISAVDVTFIDTTQATKDRINMLNAERANTRIAEQKKLTAANEAEANKILAESVSSDPNVLVRECLRLIEEGKTPPAGFQCWPNSGGSIVIPAG